VCILQDQLFNALLAGCDMLATFTLQLSEFMVTVLSGVIAF
jgi:hypothetical protein